MEGLTYNLLVVERLGESREILKRIFDEKGYRYNFLQTGESGFQKFMKQHYDLIISEIDLGEGQMSGLEFLRKVREFNTDVPFIVLAAHASSEESAQAINYGVTGYLSKPIAANDARDTVVRAIKHYKSRFLKNEIVNYSMENSYHAIIGSSEQSILKLLDNVDHLIELLYPSEYGSFPDLKMAIYEGLSNAKEHGNSNDPAKNIFFNIILRMDKIIVHIKDEGGGFNSFDVFKKSKKAVNVSRGLGLIRHLMDETSFNLKGNEINLLKIL